MKQPRLIPLVVFAASVLLLLKGVHLVLMEGQGTTLARIAMGQPADPFAGVDPDPIITGGSGGGGGGGGQAAPLAGGHDAPATGGHAAPATGGGAGVAPSTVDAKISDVKPAESKPLPGQELMTEIKILEKLAERRKLLEQREKEIDVREDVLKAAEDKIEKRIGEIKQIETRIGTAVQAKEEARSKELSDLVKMYESMKAKDAARVFDRLDTKLLVELSRQMSPKKLGDIVAKMSPEAAEKLTVEIASRRSKEAAPSEAVTRELPKIEGRGG